MRQKSKSGYRQSRSALAEPSRVFGLELRATQSLLEAIGTARALTVSLLLKYEEWEQYLELECDWRNYNDWPSFMDDYQCTQILRKNPRLPYRSKDERRAEAIRKFNDAEKQCYLTNHRIADFREGRHNVSSELMVDLHEVKTIIQKIIGSHPSHKDLEYAERNMRFGKGSTTSISGVVTRGRKYSATVLDCTESLVDFRTYCFPDLWKPVVRHLNIVQGSELSTVDKNAKTDRCICIEPDLNIFVQLGIGALIKEKLRIFGLDISSQSNNQDAARRAHTDKLATVDLSSASDTISSETVSLLLPPHWVHLLDMARSKFTKVNDEWVKLEKWSSMGNGYTFELETLIFYAVAKAATRKGLRHDVLAYGDDIIIPACSYDRLTRLLDFLGFSINTEKSFGEGRFHESCGTDWFDGVNVRPFFLRSDFHDFPTICYLYANNARRWSYRRNNGNSCDARVLPFWLRCFAAVKARDAHCIPEGYGDVGFIVDFDRATPTLRRPKGSVGWGGYWFVYRRIGAVETYRFQDGSYLAALNQGNASFANGREALRKRYRYAARKLGHTHVWPNLGPWL